MQDGEPVGSVTEGKLFSALFGNPAVKESSVADIMGDSFPVIDGTLPISEITHRFDSNTSAVLYKDTSDNYQILTKHDIIKALAD
jgi:cystathionine beta-synthase